MPNQKGFTRIVLLLLILLITLVVGAACIYFATNSTSSSPLNETHVPDVSPSGSKEIDVTDTESTESSETVLNEGSNENPFSEEDNPFDYLE